MTMLEEGNRDCFPDLGTGQAHALLTKFQTRPKSKSLKYKTGTDCAALSVIMPFAFADGAGDMADLRSAPTKYPQWREFEGGICDIPSSHQG
ncbi:hypothetical protein DGWBC_0326 [Dehalogenimonas sp. WBC-2]|nr:hypothetical protein DGWBC_0326 [Dehalogenimonas sp. WBC-2]